MQATEAVGAFINVANPDDGREWYATMRRNRTFLLYGDIQTARIVAPQPQTDAHRTWPEL